MAKCMRVAIFLSLRPCVIFYFTRINKKYPEEITTDQAKTNESMGQFTLLC